MTEDEMKTKWCPMARVAVPFEIDGKMRLAVGANRLPLSDSIDIRGSTNRSNPDSARCLGSDCALWRWEFEYISDGIHKEEKVSKTNGYCGLG